MNAIAQHVSPEEVMALLDSELTAAEAQAVSRHVEHCLECSRLAGQLRRTSESLSAWRVSPMPAKVEQFVREATAKKQSGLDLGMPNFFIRASFWTWKQWAGVSVGAVAALGITVMVLTPNLMRLRPGATLGETSRFATQRAQSPAAGGEGRGSLGKLQNERHVFNRQPELPAAGPVVLNSPAAAADSNGIFHGLGDRAVDGQPIVDQQGKLFSNPASAPMIARTVSLVIMVEDFAASRSALDAILARYQGYSAQLNVNSTQNAPRSLEASLRIPAPGLPSAITELKRLGRVQNESQTGEEVTQQHADLVARLKNARDTEQRLRDILLERTGKISDVLRVEQEIARVRGEIESMEAEQKGLEHRVDFVTLELQLVEEYKAQLNPPSPSISTRIHNAFVAGYKNASETVLGIFLFLVEDGPVFVIWLTIFVLPFIIAWRRYRKIKATV